MTTRVSLSNPFRVNEVVRTRHNDLYRVREVSDGHVKVVYLDEGKEQAHSWNDTWFEVSLFESTNPSDPLVLDLIADYQASQ